MNRRQFLAVSAALGLSACSHGLRPSRNAAQVVVVGGGYGGSTAARYLKLLAPELDVTLVDPEPAYLSCPGSNEVLAGWHDMAWLQRSRDRLSSRFGVRLIRSSAASIDTTLRRVRLDDGTVLAYDRLILSPGIAMRWDALEGYDQAAAELAPHAWKAGPQTHLLRSQIHAMPDGGVILICVPANPYRCPPGPYERASLIAHFLSRRKPRSKVIILDAKTQFSKQALFQKGWNDLYPGLIEWISSEKEGRIDHIDAQRRVVATEFGEHRAAVLNVIPPQKAGAIAERAGLTDASGWCPVDPRSFASTLQPCIHVIGDACIATPMSKSAFAANSQAKVCAAAVVDLLADKRPGLPALINHCYSLLAPDYAISINGVYEYKEETRELLAVAGGETPMDADRQEEAHFAHDWLRHIAADSFS